jgi:hypothetical protein
MDDTLRTPVGVAGARGAVASRRPITPYRSVVRSCWNARFSVVRAWSATRAFLRRAWSLDIPHFGADVRQVGPDIPHLSADERQSGLGI